MARYRLSQNTKRWLLYLGTGLIPCGLVIGILGADVWWEFGPQSAIVANGIATMLPLAITIVWLGRLLRSSHGPQERWTVVTVGTIVASLGVMIATLAWARTDERRPVENPAYIGGFAGCYQIEIGSWIPSVMAGHAAQGIVPGRLQLDTTRQMIYTGANTLAIRPAWSNGDAWWLPVDTNHVRLAWHNGFHGVAMSLERRGNELRGKAIGATDVSGPWPESRALVRARPVDCATLGLAPSHGPGNE